MTPSRTLMLVNGRQVQSADGRFIAIENPANRTVIGEVPRGGAEDIDVAVRAASAAFERWKMVPARDRGRMLMRIADAVENEVEAIARTVALETGNAIRQIGRAHV